MVDCTRSLRCGGYTDDRMNMSAGWFNTRFVYRCIPDSAIVEGAMPLHYIMRVHNLHIHALHSTGVTARMPGMGMRNFFGDE